MNVAQRTAPVSSSSDNRDDEETQRNAKSPMNVAQRTAREPWKCPTCAAVNPSNEKICQLCSTDNPNDKYSGLSLLDEKLNDRLVEEKKYMNM